MTTKFFEKIYHVPNIATNKLYETDQIIPHKLLTLTNDDEKLLGGERDGVWKIQKIKFDEEKIMTMQECDVKVPVYNMAMSKDEFQRIIVN